MKPVGSGVDPECLGGTGDPMNASARQDRPVRRCHDCRGKAERSMNQSTCSIAFAQIVHPEVHRRRKPKTDKASIPRLCLKDPGHQGCAPEHWRPSGTDSAAVSTQSSESFIAGLGPKTLAG